MNMSTSTCYRCNRTGHFARVCPQGGGDRSGRGDRDGGSFGRTGGRDKCYKCNKFGHFARDCKEEKDSPAWVICEYRSSADRALRVVRAGKFPQQKKVVCPRGVPDPALRFFYRGPCIRKYLGSGLISKYKWVSKNFRSIGSMKMCYHCNEVGHIARDCTRSPSEPSCYNCNKTGHIARNCPEGSSKSCYLCGKPGHISRDCDQANDRRSNR